MINFTTVKKYKKRDAANWGSKGKLYISVVAKTGCDRQLRFMFDGISKDADFFVWDGLENDIGIKIHDTLQKIFLIEGELKEVEVPIVFEVDEKFKMRMKIDGLTKDGDIWELKTIGVKDKGLTEPMSDHVVQLNFYLGVLGKEIGYLDYVLRDNGKLLQQFTVQYDPQLFESTVAKILNILMVDLSDLVKDKSDCNFCQYKSECKKLDKETKE